MTSGDVKLFPAKALQKYQLYGAEGHPSVGHKGICLSIYTSFLKRLSDNFPEYKDIIQHICEIQQPVTYDAVHTAQLIKELEEMHALSNEERIPHVLNILSLL